MLKRLMAVAGIIVLSLSGIALAQAPDTLWTRSFGNGPSNYGSWVIEDDDGGFVVCGMTTTASSHDSPDMYLVKTDPQGNPVWQHTYGGDQQETGRFVSKTSDGGFIVIGETYSYGKANFESPDMYLVKTDAEGIEQWYRTFDYAYGSDYGDCVQQTSDGGFVLSGGMSDQIAIIKTNSRGHESWRRYYGSGTSEAYSIRETPDHGFFITGCDYSDPALYWGGFLIKADSLGIAQWKRNYLDSDLLTIWGLDLTDDGGCILAGMVGGYSNFNVAVKKVNASGDDEWTSYIDRGAWDRAFTAEQTSDGGYIVAGITDSGDVLCSDAYVLKFDTNGQTVWDLSLGNTRSDIARCIHQLDTGGYVACGYTQDDMGDTPGRIWLLRFEPEFDPEITPISGPDSNMPGLFALQEAYPNPFNAFTTISYSIPISSPVKVIVYDMLGRPVATLLERVQEPGAHSLVWDATAQASGVYFYRVETIQGTKIEKVTLLK